MCVLGAAWLAAVCLSRTPVQAQSAPVPAASQAAGQRARAAALQRYGLERFLSEWDVLLEEVTA